MSLLWGIDVEQYQFDEVYSKEIVHAIVEGYKDYIAHRKDRHEKMKINSAFAWTKGNFIESKIAEVSDNLNLTYRKARAGLAWDYLQFIEGDKKVLFLIKNAAYFNEHNFSRATLPSKVTNERRRTYLHELSKINSKVKFTPVNQTYENKSETNVQLSLFVLEDSVKNELHDLKLEYNEFHILTYEIDHAFQIHKIMHYLPNPANNIAYKVENLSKHILGAELTDEDREVIAPDLIDDLVDPAAFDIGIFGDEESK